MSHHAKKFDHAIHIRFGEFKFTINQIEINYYIMDGPRKLLDFDITSKKLHHAWGFLMC